MWFVYMLLCDQKTMYVGITNRPIKRMNDHKNKNSFYTKQFSEIKFVYAEKYLRKSESASRERQLKGWSHAKKQKLITGELGINTCTGLVEELLRQDENLVSLLRA
jgi:putative endonuclease